MKIEESSLTGYLVKHLEPLTEADPTILSEYVVALLKKDKSIQELQKLCNDNLVEFLGHGANSFVSELFKALEDGTITRPLETFDDIRKSDPSPSITVDPVELNNSPTKEDNPSTSSRPVSDSEDKELSDDEDDDRNHKHRKRDNRPQLSDEDAQEQFARRPNRKRDKPYENGQLLAERGSQSVEIHKEYSPSLERDISSNIERRRSGLAAALSTLVDLGQKTRMSRTFHSSSGPRFDSSASLSRPLVGGRGRGTGPWNQHDSRFTPIDAIGFAPQMNSQLPSLLGTGLSSSASAQSTSWGAYGFIPGMSNGCLDPLHPLGLQGALHPSLNTLNVGMPRQRCRDFEERGFCLRGDMCPMEHGINRIVVEDVQSLSQFNLPVSFPNTSILGSQAAAVPLPPITSSNPSANSKNVPTKSSKSMVNDDGLGVSGVLSVSVGGGEADVYDPDQPLWNNDHPETSSTCLSLPSPKIEDVEPLWEAGSSDHQGFKLSASLSNERPSSFSVGNHGSQGTASVWGRIGSGNKFKSTRRIDNTLTPTGFFGNKTKAEQEEVITTAHIKHTITEETGTKTAKSADVDSGRKPGRASQKAQRTLFVNGIPQKSNRRDALLSHFQKFGEVIDIYIPLNSEKAFVQFSKREEAEAALEAPDAVMGNRFIKLWWANRDNIADGESSVHATPTAARPSATLAVYPQSTPTDKGGESRASTVPKASSAAIDGPISATIPQKTSTVGGPKTTPSLQSKVETLELLKEELRKKQESLAQKRDDFKRQLDKLEKQALATNKAEMMTDQAVKRPKVDQGAEVVKVSTPRPANANVVGIHQHPEKAQEKGSSGESIVSPSSKVSSTISQQSPRSLKVANYMPAHFVNRFKLDKRPTAFRIIPPLPADLANVAALKEHFSTFGDLVTVEFEDQETKLHVEGMKPSPNCSAIITFTTRRSAEKAFSTAKCWQGHILQFVWLMPTSSSNSGHDSGESLANPSREGIPEAEVQRKPVACGLSSSSSGTLNSNTNPEALASTGKEECAHMELDCSPKLSTNDLMQVSHTSHVSISCDEKPLQLDIPMVEDDINVGHAQ